MMASTVSEREMSFAKILKILKSMVLSWLPAYVLPVKALCCFLFKESDSNCYLLCYLLS